MLLCAKPSFFLWSYLAFVTCKWAYCIVLPGETWHQTGGCESTIICNINVKYWEEVLFCHVLSAPYLTCSVPHLHVTQYLQMRILCLEDFQDNEFNFLIKVLVLRIYILSCVSKCLFHRSKIPNIKCNTQFSLASPLPFHRRASW